MSYDLAVAYRVCARPSSHKPPVFADDKYELARLCLLSFKKALGSLRVKMFVLLDDCPIRYQTMFTELWPAEDLVFIWYGGVGDRRTLKSQVHILLEQDDSEVIYFAEDDYFYRAGGLERAFDFLICNADVAFVSCYDHPDIYKTALHDIERQWRTGTLLSWRTCMSTTHTFMTTKGVLKKVRQVFTAWYFGLSPDLSKWMAITKHRLGPSLALHNKFWAFSIFMAWVFCWRQILFGRRYKLWIPVPSIATHMVAGMEAPHVDWRALYATTNNQPQA